MNMMDVGSQYSGKVQIQCVYVIPTLVTAQYPLKQTAECVTWECLQCCCREEEGKHQLLGGGA